MAQGDGTESRGGGGWRLGWVALVCFVGIGPKASADESVDFSRDVLPILSSRCFPCHGPDEETRKAGLALHDPSLATQVLRSGESAIVPGRVIASALFDRVTTDDPDDRMPPPDHGAPLSEAEVAILERWIASGAEYETHWSFRPPRRPAEGLAASVHPVDHWIDARLAAARVTPSSEAEPSALIRRVALDLTGLPPTPRQVERFRGEPTEAVYREIVDELLASDHFGERWASVWLDLARYADTKGYEKDARRTVWPYRDWVIRAFDRDLPFDEFTIEQLAGDLLPEATLDQRLATTFHRNTMTNDEGGTDDEEFRVAAVVDRVNTTMQVWMGLTMACAQCHTHKYDPITHHEYFAFFDLLNQTEDADRPDEAPTLKVLSAEQRRRIETLKEAERALDAEMQRAESEVAKRTADWVQRLVTIEAATAPEPLFDGTFDLAPAEFAGSLEQEERYGVDGRGVRLSGDLYSWPDHGDFERDQGFSYGLWVNLDGGGVNIPLARMEVSNGHRGWDLYLQDGRPVVHLIHRWPHDAIRVHAKRVIPTRRWVHLFVSYDGSSKAAGLTISVNGRPVEFDVSHDSLRHTIRTTVPLHLGSRDSEGAFHGMVDTVTLFDRVLTPDEVRVLVLDGAAALARRPEPSDAERAALRDLYRSLEDRDGREREERRDTLRAERERLERGAPSVPVMVERPADRRRETRVMLRGNFLDLGDRVRGGVPAIFPPLEGEPSRLSLAQWLVSEANPLTARVWVNRTWEQLFGAGLVRTSEDFGIQGDRPSHPQLLDELAVRFVESGWSHKALLRTLVTSKTYRRSSRYREDLRAVDPDNRLLARGPRFRLPAEMIRDQALAVSGLLERRRYGPPVMPPQPDGVWQVVYSGDQWRNAEGPDRYRRSLYTFWRRTSPYPSAITFDAPSREFCVSRRIRTNTPLQALVTLNDPVFVEAARALGAEAAGDSANDGERIDALYRRVLARPATGAEREVLVALLESERAHYGANVGEARKLLGGGAPVSGREAAEAAAWTVLVSVLLNLDEFLTKG